MSAYLSVANFDESEEYDFTLPANKVRFIAGSLSDTTSEFGEPVELRFQTIVKGTATEIREALRDVEIIFARTSQFLLNLTSENSIWIYANSDGERIRRALVLSWQRVDTVQGHSDPLLDISKTVISDWVVTRKGYWEATLDHIYTPNITGWFGTTNLRSGACQGGVFSGTGVVEDDSAVLINKGTAPGRIRGLYFVLPTVYTTKHFDKVWFGMKTVKTLDTPTWHFKPFEPFDNVYGGTPTSYDAYVTLNYTTGMATIALNNNCVQIAFDNNTWLNRVSVPVPIHGTSPDNQAGTYQILFRMKSSDGSSVFRTAMFQAWDKIDQVYSVAETFQDVFVESDEFHLYEMGVIQVPPENFRAARREAYEEFYQLNIGIAAERLSGAGNLHLDYMIWIPQEHAISLTNIESYSNVAVNVITDEEDVHFGYTTAWTPDWEKFVHEISAVNWTWPADPDRKLIAVLAADILDGDGHHPMFEELTTIVMKVLPRYHSYNTDSY